MVLSGEVEVGILTLVGLVFTAWNNDRVKKRGAAIADKNLEKQAKAIALAQAEENAIHVIEIASHQVPEALRKHIGWLEEREVNLRAECASQTAAIKTLTAANRELTRQLEVYLMVDAISVHADIAEEREEQ